MIRLEVTSFAGCSSKEKQIDLPGSQLPHLAKQAGKRRARMSKAHGSPAPAHNFGPALRKRLDLRAVSGGEENGLKNGAVQTLQQIRQGLW